jgi:imidazolonepropionase-like amidohydrolase
MRALTLTRSWALVLTLSSTLLAGSATAEEESPWVVIEAGKVLTMDAEDTVYDHARIRLRGALIDAVGPRAEVEIPEGARVIDARQSWILPGFVDCHDHIAGSLRDLNDGVYLTNPGLRTVDTLDPDNELLLNARAGGVTTVLLIPGSGNNMSGFGTVCRTAGETVEEMILRAPGSLKIAQAGNPERYWFGVGRSYMNWNLGQTLEKAQAYHLAWSAWEEAQSRDPAQAGPPPAKDPTWEDFRPLFRGEIPVTVHTQSYQLVQKTMLMLGDRFGLRVVLDHSTFDGYKTAPLAIERETPTIVGPRQYFFDRTQRRLVGCAARWYENGVRRLGINTDAPVVPQEELTLQAAIGCRLGLDPYVALKGLTIVPAQALQVDHLVGSIEVGKEADLGVWTGDPLDPRHSVTHTLVRGKVVYDASEGRRF